MGRVIVGEFNVDGLYWATEGTGIILVNHLGHSIIEIIFSPSMGALIGWVAVYYELY